MGKLFAALLFPAALFLVDVAWADTPQKRIVGGSDASVSDVPWQTLVRISKQGSTYYCGGAIIADRWVATAAHCLDQDPIEKDGVVTPVSSSQVSLSSGFTYILDADSYTTPVKQVYIYGGYNDVSLMGDIALIELSASTPAQTQNIQIANTATQANLDAALVAQTNHSMLVSGWGKTDTNSSGSLYLQKADVNGVADTSCYWAGNAASNQIICAASIPTGTCKGDSGGPLVWVDPVYSGDADGGRRLVGIVSFGSSNGCATGTPDGYTEVATFKDWIDGCITGSCPAVSVENPKASSSGSGGGSVNPITFFVLMLTLAMGRTRNALCCND
ncbi:serine protease [Parasalinivibrio latis]|uniref:S1 family peptidase n=1 Tax=Parasalinivibrio latis TaxID=2952610 RepID=UPI0030E04BDE